MGNLRMNADQISYKGGEKPMSVEEAIKNAGNTGLAHTADIAPDFSTESAYSAGDFVYHNGTLYVFTADHAAGAWSTSDTQAVTVGGELADVKSGLTSQLEINVTLPATTDGRSSVQLPDATIPEGAKVVGCVIANVSTYSDGVSISAYFIGRTCRVTMVSNMNDIPQITLKLIVGITH